MASVSQVTKKLFALARDFAQLFRSLDFQSIRLSDLTSAYAKHFHKNLTLKEYKITSALMIEKKVPIFSYVDDKTGVHGRIELNWKKLLEFFFIPVLKSTGGRETVSNLPRAFKKVTGVDIKFLYELFDIEIYDGACERLATAVCNESTTFCLQTYPGIGSPVLQMSFPSEVKSKTSPAVPFKADNLCQDKQEQTSAAALFKAGNTSEPAPTDKQVTVQPLYGADCPPLTQSVSHKPNKREVPENISSQNTEPSLPISPLTLSPLQHSVPMTQPAGHPLSHTPGVQDAQHPLLPTPHSRFAPPDMSIYTQSRRREASQHIPDRGIPSHTHGLAMSPPMQNREVLPHMQDRGMSSHTRARDLALSAPIQGHEVLPHMQDRGSSQHTPGLAFSAPMRGRVVSPHMQGASFLPLNTAQPMVQGVSSGSTVNVSSPERYTGAKQPQNTTFTQKFPNPHLEIDREILLPAHSLYHPNLTLPRVDSSRFVPPPKKKVKKAETMEEVLEGINSKLGDVIEELSAKGKFVPVSFIRDVMHEILREVYYGRHLRIDWRNVKAMENYSKVHGRIDELIKIFCWFNPITSLYELEQALILSEKVNSFEELHMGPLLKHPHVRKFFQPADDLEEIPKISGFKIRKYLMDFLTRRGRGERKSTVEEFLEFVRMKESKDTINHLCIRVTSYSLAIQMNFRFRTSQRECQRRIDQAVTVEMEKLFQHEVERLKRKFSSLSEESIRRDLTGKNPVHILMAIFDACQKHFAGYLKTKVNDFMMTVTGNLVLQHLFLLAIYEGAYDAEKHMVKLFGEDRGHERTSTAGVQSDLFYKTEREVLEELLHQLKVIPFPVDLGSLARVEKYLAEKFGAPSFDSLGNGPYLHFLASHREVTETLGGDLIGASSSSSHTGSIKRRMLNIVHQLNAEHREDEAVVTTVICTHFGVETFQDLGCGSVSKLIADSQLASRQPRNRTPVRYMEPLLLNENKTSAYTAQAHVGILGHQTESDALACLKSAPLLEDLREWSHWDLVYKPRFGNIESFLERQHKDICALEISPGKLLRIDLDPTVSDFISSIHPSNPNPIKAAGHLVSLVVHRGSIQNVSPQLLANHVATSIEKMLAMSDELSSLEMVTEFVHNCLVRIPLKICIGLANEIFIEPLRRKASSSAVTDVMKHCKCLEHRQFFQSLGMTIGIKAWADDFRALLDEVDQELALVHHETTPPETYPSGKKGVETLQQQQLLANADPFLTKTADSSAEHMDIEVTVPTTQDDDDNQQEFPENAMDNETRDQQCRDIVESIRHDNFGIGVELDEQQRRVAEKQREREGRGLQRLSSELYTKDTHFVLELIQNADDNSYLFNESVIPSLVFILDNRVITVLNNEVGFSEKNIRAICDVGKSTKGAHRSGYIGQKGIGFKSVFRVSETPEIHSNGFYIRFDASADPIGFILPNWVEQDRRPNWETHHQWTTKVILPLKGDHLSTNMAKKFNDIQPSLLLFLHRLRSISIEDQMTGNVRQMVRTDKERGVIEIRHADSTATDVTEQWLVVRRILDKAKLFKPDVEATELAFAFPLPTDFSAVPLAKDLQHQQVFAFLPLRSYGFRFILQGDFDLPSSREDVNSDSPWNQWLREEVPSLFLESLQKIKELQDITDMEAVALFLQFIPLEGELHDFFHPISRQILNLLRGTDCLPTDPVPTSTQPQSHLALFASSELEDSPIQISWKQPSQLLFVKDKFSFIRENIPQELLSTSLNLFYLNSSVLPFVNPSLQNQLGIGDITLQHLTEVAQAALRLYFKGIQENVGSSSGNPDYEDYSDSDDSTDTSDVQECLPMQWDSKDFRNVFVKWIANWLACVHLIIEDTNDVSTAASIETLKKLPILPLADGTLDSTETTSLFFPPEFNKGGEGSHEYNNVLKELKVIDMNLFREGDDLIQSRVRKVLERLGVRNLYPSDIIKHHIVPAFTSSRCSNKPQRLLSAYLVYIKECIERRGSGVTESEIVQLLKDNVILVTNKGLKAPSKEVIHFSSQYRCDPDLQALFPDVEWTVMHQMYLKKSPKKEDLIFWRRFLMKLGVKKGLYVRRVDEFLPEDSQRLIELHSKLFRRIPAGACTVRDWQSDEFEQVVSSVVSKTSSYMKSQMSKLAKLLDENWEEEYAPCMDAKIYDAQNDHSLDANDASSFKRKLVQLAWLPCNDAYMCSAKKLLLKGTELYDSQATQIRSLLHDHVPYIGVELKTSNFISLLGIKGTIDANELMTSLQEWSQVSGFVTSIEHMRNVYVYLQRAVEDQATCNMFSVTDLFKEEKLIFVPDQYSDRETGMTSTTGSFYSIHSVCWIDPSTVLYYNQKHNRDLPSGLPKVLQLYYGMTGDPLTQRVQQAFNYFGIPQNPRVSAYISLLKHVSSLSPTPEPHLVKDFTSVALYLVSLCANDSNISSSYIFSNLKKARVFPSHNEIWVTLEDCLLENDSPELAKCFRETEGIHFLQWPAKLTESHKSFSYSSRQHNFENQQAREEFIKICQIPKLSAKASPRITTVGVTTPEDEIRKYLNIWVPLIQRFLTTFCPQIYSQLKLEGIQEIFPRIQCLSVDSLDCRYSLTHEESVIEGSSSIPLNCAYTTDTSSIPVIYIAKSKVTRLGSLLPALMKLFMNNPHSEEDAETFRRFLTENVFLEQPSTAEEAEAIANACELSSIPEIDVVWNFPLPRYQVIEEDEVESMEDSQDEEDDFDMFSREVSQPRVDSREHAGVTSWPPKASVPSHSDETQRYASTSQRQRAVDDGTDNIIGEDDFKDIRSKYIEGQSSSVPDVQEHSPGPQVPNSAHVTEDDHVSSSLGGSVTRHRRTNDSSQSLSIVESQPQGTSSADHNLPTQQGLPTDTKSKHTLSSTTKHTATMPEQERTRRWKEHEQADSSNTEIDLVSIEQLVQSVQKDSNPLIPLLDDPTDDEESLLRIGRWGEQFVYTLLKRSGELPDGRKIKQITWVNEVKESGKPYDLELELESDQPDTVQRDYIDVKSTASGQKELVAASWKELKFAQAQSENYYIYRVYGAGSSSSRVCLVRNLCAYLEVNQTRLFFML